MNHHLNRRDLMRLALCGAAALPGASLWAAAPAAVMYRSSGCGCCLGWVEAMKRAAMPVRVVDTEDMLALKRKNGVPEKLMSCHTTLIGGYVVEGHVPPADIARLLRTRPRGVRGIAVPGMPMGAPGMEAHGGHKEAYQVFAFDGTGRARVFASH